MDSAITMLLGRQLETSMTQLIKKFTSQTDVNLGLANWLVTMLVHIMRKSDGTH